MTGAADVQVEWLDPRPYGSGRDSPLVTLATASAAAGRGVPGRLTARLRELAAAGDDAAIDAAFAAAPDQRVRRLLLEAL